MYKTLILTMMLIATTTLGVVEDGEAGSIGGKMTVQVTVLPVFEYGITGHAGHLVITEPDVKNGYKDIGDRDVITVTTNSLDGYGISVALNNVMGRAGESVGEVPAIFTSVTLNVDNKTYTVPVGGNLFIRLPYNGANPYAVVLSYRFTLAPWAAPGAYPWPVSVTASP
ncbi:MAG: hypothetical protein HY884_01020 [Deltaproteobacteria bacterium]|nr:hypothetical protein [Deltaproteobacteria bacterium]